jgi:hypothetical protein
MVFVVAAVSQLRRFAPSASCPHYKKILVASLVPLALPFFWICPAPILVAITALHATIAVFIHTRMPNPRLANPRGI